jgi:hypothetical protein
MTAEVGRRFRNAALVEESRHSDNQSTACRDLARDHGGIAQHPRAKRYVHALLDEVACAVAQDEVEREVRVLIEENMEPRHDVQACDRHAGTGAQATAEASGGARDSDVCVACLVDDLAGAFIEVLASFGRCQSPRRTHQQPHAEPFFQVRNGLGHGRLANLEIACCRRE